MSKLHPKYAHNAGITKLAYSKDGQFLFTVGSNQLIRKFQVGSVEEPLTIEQHDGPILDVATSNNYFATCSEDGTVSLFDIKTNEYLTTVMRCSLPIREIEFSPDGEWIAVCSE
jgi:chromosome transmission fidelity protein 4